MVEVQTKAGDMLNRLGVPAEVVDQKLLARVPLQSLKKLGLAYGPQLVDANKFSKDVSDTRVELPPFGFNPSPQTAMNTLRRPLGRTYFRKPGEAKHASANQLMQSLFAPRTQRGAKMARLLQKSEPVRNSFEKTAGAKVVLDGRNDGKISMRVPESGVSKSAMSGGGGGGGGYGSMPSSREIDSLLAAMDAAVLEQAYKVQLGNLEGNQNSGSGYGSLGANTLYGPDVSGAGASGLSGTGEGDDEGSTASGLDGLGYTPGGVAIGPGNPINQPDQRAESVDIATLHLKRLMDKRDQMYDLFRQVNDKHNQAANTAVNNMKA